MNSVPVLELECDNVTINKSKIPLVDIVTAKCNDIELTFDIHRELNVLKNATKLKIGIYREKPDCSPDKDYCGLGYVFSITSEEEKTKILISIGGYIVRLIGSFEHNFKPMDRVYVKISNIS